MNTRRRRRRRSSPLTDTDTDTDSDEDRRRASSNRKPITARNLLKKASCSLARINLQALLLSILYSLAALVLLGFLYYYGPMILSSPKRLLPQTWGKSTENIVEEALEKYSADRLNVADYALESAGGSVVCSSETYFMKEGALYTVFGIPVWYHSSNPRAVIQPDVQPGQCWAMDGSKGFVTIQLAMTIVPTAVSLEHIPASLATSGLSSAPKDFQIEAQEVDLNSPSKVLGRFVYNIEDGHPIQMFGLKDHKCLQESGDYGLSHCETNKEQFAVVTLRILSNHGNDAYTCIYRVRFHGNPPPNEAFKVED